MTACRWYWYIALELVRARSLDREANVEAEWDGTITRGGESR